MSMGQILALLALFLGLAILPWCCYFPVDARSLACLLGEFLLFVLYVLPPLRLKERGLLGLVTDALYAHALPTYLAAITFEALAAPQGGALWPLLASLVAWQFCLGLRNILLHQLKDADNDRRSGLRTYVTQAGELRATHLLAHVLVPLELLTWLLLLGALTSLTWLPLLCWPIYLAWQFPKGHRQLDLRAWLYRYMDDFYIGWLPLAILVAACWQDWRLIGLAGLHLLLFKSAFSQARNRLFHMIYRPS
jgi:4-hydroxybenzoate polyprenyltransferase